MKKHHSLFFLLIALISHTSFALTTSIIEDSLSQTSRIIRLKKGTDIKLKFAESVSSADLEKGRILHLEVYGDIIVDGVTIISTATLAEGKVLKVRRRGMFGRGGYLRIKPSRLMTDGNQSIDLRGPEVTKKGKDKQFLAVGASAAPFAVAATIGAPIIVLPVTLVTGLFVKGKDAEIAKGTIISAMIGEDVIIKL